MACLVIRGFAVADMDKMTIGMCVNMIKAFDRLNAAAHGKEISDPEVQYQKLKRIQPIVEEKYRTGKITKEKYDAFMLPILEYEAL